MLTMLYFHLLNFCVGAGERGGGADCMKKGRSLNSLKLSFYRKFRPEVFSNIKYWNWSKGVSPVNVILIMIFV